MYIQDLLEIPYEKRKYIYIVKDEMERKAMLLDFLPISTPIFKLLRKRKKQEQRQTVYYALRNQVYGVLFPKDGIPLNHTIYVCNPIDTRRYYTVDDFHKEMINHKVYEAIYLLRSLGAIKIDVLVDEEANQNFDLNFSFKMFSGNNNFSGNHNSKLKFSASYAPNDKPPFIPEDVYWIDHEPQWKYIANERMNNGLTSFELVVDVSDDFGVNSELVAQLKGTKSNINNTYHEFKKTSLILTGKFSN